MIIETSDGKDTKAAKVETSAEREKRQRRSVRRIKSSNPIKHHKSSTSRTKEVKRTQSDEDKKALEKKEQERKERAAKKPKSPRRSKTRKEVPLANRVTYENGATEKTSLVVYWAPNSPSPNIVVLFLQVAKIPYKSVQFQWQDTASRENRIDRAYWRINPNRSIPTIVDGDYVLFESHTIIRYLAEKYCPENSAFYPSDPVVRAKIDNALEWNLTHLRTSTSPLSAWLSILHSIMGQRPELVSDYWGSNAGYFQDSPNGAISTFARFEREWLKSGDFVAGMTSPSVADIAMFADFSFSYNLLHLDHALTPELYPALHAWNFKMKKFLKSIPQYLVYSGIQNALAAYFPSPPEMPLDSILPWHDYLFPGATEVYQDHVEKALGSDAPWPSPSKKELPSSSSSPVIEETSSSATEKELKSEKGTKSPKEGKSPRSKSTRVNSIEGEDGKKHISKSKSHSKSHSKSKSIRHHSTSGKVSSKNSQPEIPKYSEEDDEELKKKKHEEEEAETSRKAQEEAAKKTRKAEEEAAAKLKADEESEVQKTAAEEEERKRKEEEAEEEAKRKAAEVLAEAKGNVSSTESDESESNEEPTEVVDLSSKPIIPSPPHHEDTSSSSLSSDHGKEKTHDDEAEGFWKKVEDEKAQQEKLKKEQEQADRVRAKEQEEALLEKLREEEQKAQDEEQARLKEEARLNEEERQQQEARAKEEERLREEAAQTDRKRQADEDERKRQAEEEDSRRKQQEDLRRKAQEEEQVRKRMEQEEQARKEKVQEEERKTQAMKQAAEEDRKRKEADDRKRKEEEERKNRRAEVPLTDEERERQRIERLVARRKAEQQDIRDFGSSRGVTAPKFVVSPAISLTNTEKAEEAAPKPVVLAPANEPTPPSSDSESDSDDEEDPEPSQTNFLEHAKWEARQIERENLRERRRVEKDMKKRGLAIPAFKPKPAPASPPTVSSPKTPIGGKNSTFQGMNRVVPVAEKPTSSFIPRQDTAKSGGIAAKLKAMREQEEARMKAQQEWKEAEAKKKKETEEAWRLKQVEQARLREKEREANSSRTSTSSESKHEIVSSAPLDPMAELELIRKAAAASGADSYFNSPKD